MSNSLNPSTSRMTIDQLEDQLLDIHTQNLVLFYEFMTKSKEAFLSKVELFKGILRVKENYLARVIKPGEPKDQPGMYNTTKEAIRGFYLYCDHNYKQAFYLVKDPRMSKRKKPLEPGEMDKKLPSHVYRFMSYISKWDELVEIAKQNNIELRSEKALSKAYALSKGNEPKEHYADLDYSSLKAERDSLKKELDLYKTKVQELEDELEGFRSRKPLRIRLAKSA